MDDVTTYGPVLQIAGGIVGGLAGFVASIVQGPAVTMIVVLPGAVSWLSRIPTAALASVVFVSALTLFDLQALIMLVRMNWRGGLLSSWPANTPWMERTMPAKLVLTTTRRRQ